MLAEPAVTLYSPFKATFAPKKAFSPACVETKRSAYVHFALLRLWRK